jgi:hypothetical protein
LAHDPQWATSVRMSVSQPLVGLPSQSSWPGLQSGTHTPPSQPVVPCSLAQTTPQAPQLSVGVRTSVSQPLAGSPSQLPVPGAQHRVIPLGEKHLRTVLSEGQLHYHTERNHQGLDNELLTPLPAHSNGGGSIQSRERLDGILN